MVIAACFLTIVGLLMAGIGIQDLNEGLAGFGTLPLIIGFCLDVLIFIHYAS